MALTQWMGCPAHLLPGRLRIRVPELQGNQRLARRLTAALGQLPGVRHALANPDSGYALVVYDPAALSLTAIGQALGLPAPARGRPTAQRADSPRLAERKTLDRQSAAARTAARQAILTGGALALVAAKRLLVGPSPLALSWATYDLAGFVTVAAGYPYLARGLRDLVRNRRLSSDLLIAAASLTLLILRENLLGLGVLFLTALNRLLAARILEGCRRAVDRLAPRESRPVRVVRDRTPTVVPASAVRPGDVVVLGTGAVLPADGEVTSGSALVDPSVVTGEASLRVAGIGDQLLAGTRLIDGSLGLRATAVGADTQLGRIVEMTGPARPGRHDRRLTRQHRRRANRWARWALGVAMLTGLLTGDWRRALAALIAAAPSATAMAAALPLSAGAAAASRRGILVKHTGAVAAAGLVDTVLFDKTGTLTAGRPQVAAVLPAQPDWTAGAILATAAAAEQHAFHPYGRAIREEARARRLHVPPGRRAQEQIGQGASAEVAHHRVWVGSESLMAGKRLLKRRAKLLGERLRLQGYSVVYVASDGEVVGVIGLTDRLRAEAKEAVADLRRSGITEIGVLTGDHPDAAEAVATGLGLEAAWGGAAPEEKSKRVAALKAEGHTVALVGDGINDAPALAAADLGVALSHNYAGPALRSADAVLLDSDPRRVSELIAIGQQTLEVARQNQVLAGGLNATGLGLAATGAIGPLAATIWHNLTSLIVLGNSARLLRHQAAAPIAHQRACPSRPRVRQLRPRT